MAADAVVRARIEESVKVEATAVLADMGLTVSDAFRMLMVRVAKEKALPFEVRVPNATTIKAMEESRAIKKPRFDNLQDMIADLENPAR